MAKKKAKQYVLKEDFVIKAGTVFNEAATTTKRYGEHIEAVIGIGNDACAFMTMCVDDSPDPMELFEVTHG